MINKERNVNTISNTLLLTLGRHIQTFSKLFAKSLELVESICTKNNYIWLFWFEQIMNYPLGFTPIWLLRRLWAYSSITKDCKKNKSFCTKQATVSSFLSLLHNNSSNTFIMFYFFCRRLPIQINWNKFRNCFWLWSTTPISHSYTSNRFK